MIGHVVDLVIGGGGGWLSPSQPQAGHLLEGVVQILLVIDAGRSDVTSSLGSICFYYLFIGYIL
jgi:hypothetical protein